MSRPKDSRPVRTIKQLGAENDRLASQVEALKGACRAFIDNIDSGRSILRWSPEYVAENRLDSDDEGNIDAMRAALAAVEE